MVIVITGLVFPTRPITKDDKEFLALVFVEGPRT